MALETYPTLKGLFEDLTRLDAREKAEARKALREGVQLVEGRDLTRVDIPWLDPGTFWCSGPQREVIRQLVAAMVRSDNPDVSEQSLLHLARANVRHLSELFAGHAAWETAILPGSRPGTYRLTAPPSEGESPDVISREPVE